MTIAPPLHWTARPRCAPSRLPPADVQPRQFKPYTRHTIHTAPQWQGLPEALREATQVVSRVLPLRTNAHVLDELIDWQRVPDDPIYRLTFPHADMLAAEDYRRLRDLVLVRRDDAAIEREVRRLRLAMNPHPGGQMSHNVPLLDGNPLAGVQHKYHDTVLFFPTAGQTCHAYCSYCFRWAQFIGDRTQRFGAADTSALVRYLQLHREVSDVLVTGGDPLVMGAQALATCLEPLLVPELSHVQNIRIGTKALAYWPQRFLFDADADALLRLFGRITAAGRHLALMVHFSHPVELRHPLTQQAVRRLANTGLTMRLQAPLVRHVNDDAAVWVELWNEAVRLGMVPYYLFIERDTGAHDYFCVPLARACDLFSAAYRSVSGLARTVRGPVMSTFEGKVVIDGVVTLGPERVFALQLLRARNPDWVRRPFYARFDPHATWFDELLPAFDAPHFFFQRVDDAHRRAPMIPITPVRHGPSDGGSTAPACP
ncbi:KamA family radical SAM protein [Caldimonas brevitalea]|uniref:Lysine 2,3-aminomutase n=1 Tax=Caldimonas brevitalea TaxID=413882 RepID=A0A0G3BXC2_9BURK|nr:lysine 2,3-aminomutase [Caldimonas brevitalea]AKJ32021.1 lysine 2,3-aminomutase [Caldimonas brevitalea]